MIEGIINPFKSLFEAFPYVLDGIRVAVLGFVLEMARRYAFRGTKALKECECSGYVYGALAGVCLTGQA